MNRPNVDHVHARCVGDVEDAYTRVREVDTDKGLVLTDDFNPVEFYDAANREALRRDLARSVKSL